MHPGNPTINVGKAVDDNTNEEPLPVKVPSFRSRFLARLTPVTVLNRSISVPHRSQVSSSTSPKPNADKWRGFQPDSVPATPTTPAIPGGNLGSYYSFQSIESDLKPNYFRPSGLLRRTKSHRNTNDSKENRISSSLPETDWESYFDKISSREPNTASQFKDPILVDLDSQLPDPIPPPRAYPPWLKVALRKQASVPSEKLTICDRNTTQHHNLPDISCETSGTLATSFPCLQRQTSVSADGSRICPIMQNGAKVSDTHYWLIAPHRPQPTPCLGDNRAPEGASFFHKQTDYLNVPIEPKLRRNQSAVTADKANSSHIENFKRLKLQVPKASDEECAAVLIGANYNYGEALQRLLLEIMCKRCAASKVQCKQILQKHNWDLEKAIAEVPLIVKDGWTDATPKRRPQKLSSYSFNRQELLPSPLEISTGFLPERSKPEIVCSANAEQDSPTTTQSHSKTSKEDPTESRSAAFAVDHTKFDSPEDYSPLL